MPTGRGGAAALLQKVNSQLRGERVPIVTKEEDELAVYLSSLQQKTQQVRSTSFEDHGDISISSGKDDRLSAMAQAKGTTKAAAPAVSSKFLKKKKPTTQQSQPAHEDEDDERAEDDERGIVITGKKKVGQPGSTAALDKAQVLAKKIKDARGGGTPFRRHFSKDSDSESELGRRPASADTSVGRDGRKFLKGRNTVNGEDNKPQTRSPSPQIANQSHDEKKSKHRRSSKARGEIVRTLGNVYLSSDEESLADFIQGLSASESSVRRPQNLVAKRQQKWRKSRARQSPSPVQGSRSPSPFKRSPSPMGKVSRSLSQDSDLVDSMATDVIDDRKGGSVSSEDNFNINLMDVATLLPSPTGSPRRKKKSGSKSPKEPRSSPRKSRSNTKDPFKASAANLIAVGPQEKKSKPVKKKATVKRSDSKSSLFENLGIHMVDEILDLGGVQQNANVDMTDDSEIHTERSDDRKKKAVRVEESESEIVTELGGGDSRRVPIRRAISPEKSMTISERLGVDSSVKRQPRSPSVSEGEETSMAYSEDTFETSRTLSASLSQTPPMKKKHSSKSRTSQRSEGNQRRVVVEQQHTQLATADLRGAMHHYQSLQTGVSVSGPYGLQYVDPAPVATHIVSADALEAITSYSPNMLALQEMLRAQLELVKNFVELQGRIYHSCLQASREDYHYTTLEGTKQYIEENRKPRMTFKEALRLVDQEEGFAPADPSGEDFRELYL